MNSEEVLLAKIARLAREFEDYGKRVKVYLEIEDDGEYPWRAFEFDGTNMTPEEPGVMITKEYW